MLSRTYFSVTPYEKRSVSDCETVSPAARSTNPNVSPVPKGSVSVVTSMSPASRVNTLTPRAKPR